MNTKTLISGIVALVIFAGVIWYGNENSPPPVAEEEETARYVNETYDISFDRPAGYILEEKEVGNLAQNHYAIMLVEDTEENRDVLAGRSPGREGPVAITVDVFSNLENQTLTGWVENMSFSNYNLALAPYTETTLGNERALSYTWDGLYRGDSFVVADGNYIYMLSVTYLTPDDTIRADFQALLETVSFE